jgi:single-stranded-DNA-specific exonuclease
MELPDELEYGDHRAAPWSVQSAHLPVHLPLREKLLLLRALPPGPERDLFLHPDAHARLGHLLGDPSLLPDAAAAVDTLAAAIASGEEVCVYGDYDADGVTGTAILVRGLRQLGARVQYYIPHRVEEGFGLNEHAVRTLAGRGCSLLITVDCGTSDAEEVALANSLGLTVIITDHHRPPEKLPDAAAVVNPHRHDSAYPDGRLTGAGVAYTLLRALAYKLDAGGRMRAQELAQLAALGTIADVAPLRGENRLLVRAGLAAMRRSPLPGIRALLASSGLAGSEVSETDVSFKLAPRLNAAGRMAHATLACELLLERDPHRARELAARLETLNRNRRETSDGMLAVAADIVSSGAAYGGDVLTVYHEGWSPALLGIVAGRLSRLHSVPVVAATREGDWVRASVRSVPGLDVMRALEGCQALLTEHGGHSQAAGFSTTLSGLRGVHDHLLSEFVGTRRVAPIEVDVELGAEELSPALAVDVATLAPYGAGNPEPLFGLRGVRPRAVRVFGKQGAHLSFAVPGAGGLEVEVVGFGKSDCEPVFVSGGPVDLVVRATRHYQGGSYHPLRLALEHAFPHSA